VNTRTGTAGNQLSWQDLEDIRASTQSFEAVVTDNSSDATWVDGDQHRNIPVLRTTPNFAAALRLRPALGRMFLPSDADAAADSVALISHELWQSRFAGDPEVLDQTVQLDSETRRIVGVLPPGFQFPVERAPASGRGSIMVPGEKQFWVPMARPRGEDGTSRGARMFLGIGRLKPGVTEAEARAELAVLSRRLEGSIRNQTATGISRWSAFVIRSSAARFAAFRC
jgi:hypothetical protein